MRSFLKEDFGIMKIMTQAPIAINGKDVVDLALRNSLRESISEEKEVILNVATYVKLLSYIGKIPSDLSQANESDIMCICKPKYRYIYDVGGHMICHTDTIKGDTHIGTLVLIEQYAINGGNLVIHGLYPKIYGSVYDCEYGVEIIPIGALHEITPVIKGRRISRVYEIHSVTPTVNMSIGLFNLNTLTMQCMSITDMIQSRTWDKTLVERYTKGNDYIAFSDNIDAIQSLILRMIIDTYGVKEYTKSIICTRDGSASYGCHRCTILGDDVKELHSYSEYNDEGYDKYSYYVANILYIGRTIDKSDQKISRNSIRSTFETITNTSGSIYDFDL